MQPLELEALYGGTVTLDLCFACHGIWFDQRENLKLSPDGVLTLFHALHSHRNDPLDPLRERMHCPRCERTLHRGHNRTISGLYTVHRCTAGHGHFSTFASFMVEKGFVRHLTPAEVHQLARRLRVIHCTSCGAPVDLRRHHACPYCSSAFSLLDPDAVTRALQRFEGERQRRHVAGEAATLALVDGLPPDGAPGGNARQPGAMDHGGMNAGTGTGSPGADSPGTSSTGSGAADAGAGAGGSAGILKDPPRRRGADGSAPDASLEASQGPDELRASIIMARREAEYLGEKRRQQDRIQGLREGVAFGMLTRSPGDSLWSWGLDVLWATLRHWWR
jgi:hypothetical protein